MTEYGLPGLRDSEGNIQQVDHTYTWDGEEITIKLDPPTITQQEEYEELGEEASADDMREIVDRHLVKPEINGVLTTRELVCYVEGIVDFSVRGGGEVADAVRDELDGRELAAGN